MGRQIKIIALLFLGLIIAVKFTFAQLPAISTSANKKSILIGQQIDYKVQVSMPANTYQLKWFNIPKDFGGFEAVSIGKLDTSISNNKVHLSQSVTLTNFDSGRRVIPSLPFKVETLSGDSSFTMLTDSIVINVGYSPLDSIQPFHDIKTILQVKNSWPWWVWALIAAGGLLIVLLIIYLIKKLKRKKQELPLFDSKLSPYEEAMQSFTGLEKENLVEQNRAKEFHTKLVIILKRYLSRKTNVNQYHLTTEEILTKLNEYHFSEEQISGYANSLQISNAVKFAKYIPPASEDERCMSEIKNMVTEIHKLSNQKLDNDL
jgi:hypothetical protein